MNKKWIWMCLSLMLPISLRAVAHDEVGSGQTQRSAVSLSEFGKNASGITTYSLRSDNAPVQDVLRILFSRKGDNNYAVSDTVNGVVSMNVRGVTLDEALTLVQNMTPSIRIVNGIIVKSARDPKEIAARIQAQLDNKYMTPAQSSSLEQAPKSQFAFEQAGNTVDTRF